MEWDSSKEYLEDYNNSVEIKMEPNKPYNPLRLKRRMFLRKFQRHENDILGHAIKRSNIKEICLLHRLYLIMFLNSPPMSHLLITCLINDEHEISTNRSILILFVI